MACLLTYTRLNKCFYLQGNHMELPPPLSSSSVEEMEMTISATLLRSILFADRDYFLPTLFIVYKNEAEEIP